MTITVANFITQYLRPTLASATEWPDATLGIWINQALIDISRSFPRQLYATWDAITGQSAYAYADSLTVADENTIIRVLNCFYPYVSATDRGNAMTLHDHTLDDFEGGAYYHPDNAAQALYIGYPVVTLDTIYSDCQCYWTISAATIVNPSEHYELIRLFVLWQVYHQQLAELTASPVPENTLLVSLTSQVQHAEGQYRDAYNLLDQSKATSSHTSGWSMDKWDPNEK